jgi:hypothetical protein
LVNALIREYRPSDEEPVVELSLRAWAPVFASLEQTLGREIFVRLHGDWSQYQASPVRRVLADAAIQVWVAEAQGLVVAFVAGMVDHERHLGRSPCSPSIPIIRAKVWEARSRSSLPTGCVAQE